LKAALNSTDWSRCNDAEFVFRTSAIAVAYRGPYPWAAAAWPAAAEPSAAGLWQKIEKRRAPAFTCWSSIKRRLEGVMAKLFPKPGSTGPRICSECTDDLKEPPWLGISFVVT